MITRRKISMGAWAMLLAVFVMGGVAACGDATGPSGDFLIRLPDDNPPSAFVVSFTASQSSTESIDFEWEPATGADSYRVVFWRSADRDAMNQLQGDFSSPAFTLEVASPHVSEVEFNPSNDEDERTLTVVQHEARLSDVAAMLSAAGIPAGEQAFFVWSVFAESGGQQWRSIETQRMVLTREES